MKNFLKLATGADVKPLLNAIMTQPELWNQNTLRTMYPQSPHHQVEDIWLRFDDLELWKETQDPAHILDSRQAVWYPAADRLPQARPFIFSLMRMVEAEQLGRVMITKLAPGKVITPHADGGAQAEWYSRYHVVLQAEPGANFRAGDEWVHMATGETWWFNNKVEHEVVNNSRDDRITMIIDVRVN